jgi:hypothetical protein
VLSRIELIHFGIFWFLLVATITSLFELNILNGILPGGAPSIKKDDIIQN